jgi:uncharacterized protein YdbL (DUF1318 family)
MTMFAKLSRTALFAALAGVLLTAPPAQAQADSVVEQAKAAGQVGEQADGFLGFPPGASASADLRARVDQINIRRRAAYTERAQQRGVTASEMAAAVACQIFAQRIQVGERYRDQSGQWRTRTAGQSAAMPSFCP